MLVALVAANVPAYPGGTSLLIVVVAVMTLCRKYTRFRTSTNPDEEKPT
jgi:preprotein translocase subunit SecY